MKRFVFASIILLFSNSVYSNMKSDSDLKSYIFFTNNDLIGQEVLIRGKISSISSSEELPESELSGIALEKTKVTVRLYDKEGVNAGDVLYVIDNNNLVVSKFTVKYIFYNRTFGYMLVGYGNLKLSNVDYRVAQAVYDPEAGEAYKYKARGDYYLRTGDKGKAIAQYKKAVEMNRNDPSARLALGLVYYNDKINNFAYNEFLKAYEHIESLYDNEDRFVLLNSLGDLCFREAYHNNNVTDIRLKFWKSAIKYSREALQYKSKSVVVNNRLGNLYYMNLDKNDDNDKMAKNAFLKVVEVEPSNYEANYKLALLYKKHGNANKALFYIRKAVYSNPSSEEARGLLNELD